MKKNLVKKIALSVVAGIVATSTLIAQVPMVANAASYGGKIVGYVRSNGCSNHLGFKVGVPALGGRFYCYTSDQGYFELMNIPSNMTNVTLKITDYSSHLDREIKNIDLSNGATVQLGTIDKPVQMWSGDIPDENGFKDNKIDQADQNRIISRMNSVNGDGTYSWFCDLNRDSVINIQDLNILNQHINATPVSYPSSAPFDYEDLSTSICTWKDNKQSAYSPTYDDAYLMDDHVLQAQLHKKYGVKGTLFINTETDMWGNRWEVLRTILNEGYLTLGGHTRWHSDLINPGINLYDELKVSQDILQSQTGIKPLALAYPRYLTNQTVIDETMKYYIAARWGNDIQNESNPGIGINDANTKDYYKILSMCPDTQTPAATFNSWLDRSIDNGGWLVTTMHGINGGWHLQNYADLDSHYSYTKTKQDAGKVWTGSFEEIAKYLRERQNASAAYSYASSSNSFLIKVDFLYNSGLDTGIYNDSVTLKMKVPSDWNTATVTNPTGGTPITVSAININGAKHLIFNAVPETGNYTVTKVN